ncbi:hypothetical protein ACFE04_024296 [Oxalis oulophora]
MSAQLKFLPLMIGVLGVMGNASIAYVVWNITKLPTGVRNMEWVMELYRDRYCVILDVVDGNSSDFFLPFESTARKVEKIYVVLNLIELQGDKRTFVVNCVEDDDATKSSTRDPLVIATPTKAAKV